MPYVLTYPISHVTPLRQNQGFKSFVRQAGREPNNIQLVNNPVIRRSSLSQITQSIPDL